jgi:deoxyribodipyrimidine photo-lyase
MASKKTSKKKDDGPTVRHAPDSLFPDTSIDPTRTKMLTLSITLPREKETQKNPCIIYWMIRDCRTIDNWALLFAQSLAIQNSVPLRVVYTLPPPPDEEPSEGEDGSPPNPTDMSLTKRHGIFLLEGLHVVSQELEAAKVPLDVLSPPSRGKVGETVYFHATTTHDALAIVTDMSPLRAPRQWTEKQSAHLFESSKIPMYQVDAHNIVPVWIASPKREVGARTLRPKIHNVFGGYCCTFPEFKGNAHLSEDAVPVLKGEHDWKGYKKFMKLDKSIELVSGMKAGHEAAMRRWKEFCSSTQQGL